MFKTRAFVGGAVLALLASGAQGGITDTASGNIGIGSDGSGVVDGIDEGWQDGGDYTCGETGNTLTVEATGANSAGCSGRKVTAAFTVPGGQTGTLHPFKYEVTCDLPFVPRARIRHRIAFDEDANDNIFTPIDSGLFTFQLNGGDVIEIYTTEGPVGAGPGDPPDAPTESELARIPALGEWGAMLLGAAILGFGVLLILRKRQGSGPLAP